MLQRTQKCPFVQEREISGEVLFVYLKLTLVSKIREEEGRIFTSSFQTVGVSKGDSRALSYVPKPSLEPVAALVVGAKGFLRFFGGP